MARASPANQTPIMEAQKEKQSGFVGAGGTPGGVGMFLLGFAMACAGGWLLTNQVTVSSAFFASGFMVPVVNYHMNAFGLSLVPFIFGIGFLFFDGKSAAGWLLTIAGDYSGRHSLEPAHLLSADISVQHAADAGPALWWAGFGLALGQGGTRAATGTSDRNRAEAGGLSKRTWRHGGHRSLRSKRDLPGDGVLTAGERNRQQGATSFELHWDFPI